MQYTRVKQLVGDENYEEVAKTGVLIFRLGGVGGTRMDALFRTGFAKLTLIDADSLETANLNRQVHSEHIGKDKVEVFAKIYQVKGIVAKVDEEFLSTFDLSKFDIIIDAINDISAKVALTNKIDFKKQVFISSTGGARKLDPTLIKTTSIFKTYGDALAEEFRYKLRKSGFKGDFDVVFSNEEAECKNLGSFMRITASFGLALVSLVLKKVSNTDKFWLILLKTASSSKS